MTRHNAKELEWEKVEVFGVEGLFVDLRVDKTTVPDGYFMYEVRHCDEDWCEPAEISTWIMVNFFGTLLLKDSLEGQWEYNAALNKPYKCIEDDSDWNYLDESFEFEEE